MAEDRGTDPRTLARSLVFKASRRSMQLLYLPWYAEKDSNLQIYGFKPFAYAVRLSALGTPGQIRTDTTMVLNHLTLPLAYRSLVPSLGFEPRIVQCLKLLRMPFRHEGLEDRIGLAPMIFCFAGRRLAARPTIHLVEREGLEPSTSDLQSVVHACAPQHIWWSRRVTLPLRLALQTSALLLSYKTWSG